MRFDTDDLEWFERNFPWRGSLSQLCKQVLAEFREAWGDQPPPHTVVSSVVRRLNSIPLKDTA